MVRLVKFLFVNFSAYTRFDPNSRNLIFANISRFRVSGWGDSLLYHCQVQCKIEDTHSVFVQQELQVRGILNTDINPEPLAR